MQAYCLMPDRFHLVVETPLPMLVAGMKWLLGTYTGRFHRRHKLFEHLFSGRYKALIVDGVGPRSQSRSGCFSLNGAKLRRWIGHGPRLAMAARCWGVP